MYLRIVCICVAVVRVGLMPIPTQQVRHLRDLRPCIACHSGLHTAAGEDVSIGYDWRATMMANSARDPYWHAAVRREVTRPSGRAELPSRTNARPAICRWRASIPPREARAARCSQIIDYGAPAHREAFDGVSCTVCHQIAPENLGTHASFDGGFEIERGKALGARALYGPHSVDSAHESVMRSAARFVADSVDAHTAVRAVRDLPHALHHGARRARGDHRRAPGASALSGVAAQRLSRDAQLPELPHAGGRRGNGDLLGPRHAEAAPVSAHVSRRQRLHARDTEQVPRRARYRGVAAGARYGRARDESLSRHCGGDDCDRLGPARGLRARYRRAHREHDGPQAADGVPGAARLGSPPRHGRSRARRCSSRAHRVPTGRSPATTTTRTRSRSSRTARQSTLRTRCRSTSPSWSTATAA